MLVTLREVLADARARHYAVPAFDCTEDVMVRTILETAQSRRSPVILMTLDMDVESGGGNGWVYLSSLIKAAAAHHSIPVVLHMDHAKDLATIQQALSCGYSSVMIDGSQLPFEGNAALTRSVVQAARPYGASVEAELGHVGGMDLEDKSFGENVLTEPEEVTRFVEQTGCDALAVSIGTSHGVYRSLPNLNIARLKELNAASQVPLVLHGGSGNPEDQLREAVHHGICKLNLYADLRVAMYRGLKASAAKFDRIDPLPADMFQPIRDELVTVINDKIDLLGSAQRA